MNHARKMRAEAQQESLPLNSCGSQRDIKPVCKVIVVLPIMYQSLSDAGDGSSVIVGLFEERIYRH